MRARFRGYPRQQLQPLVDQVPGLSPRRGVGQSPDGLAQLRHNISEARIAMLTLLGLSEEIAENSGLQMFNAPDNDLIGKIEAFPRPGLVLGPA